MKWFAQIINHAEEEAIKWEGKECKMSIGIVFHKIHCSVLTQASTARVQSVSWKYLRFHFTTTKDAQSIVFSPKTQESISSARLHFSPTFLSFSRAQRH